jgi:trans-aconitate methyltransferase
MDGSVPNQPESLFDTYAGQYDAALERGLSATGESKAYFARGRAEWLATRFRDLGLGVPSSLLDFGCGTGSAVPFLHAAFPGAQVHGVDVSSASLERARTDCGGEGATFSTPDELPDVAAFDLVFCNGVFHHIPETNHSDALEWISRRLRPGAVFALWENNPWNPGTRYVMSRIAFDRNAVLLTPRRARDILRTTGFEILSTDYLFIFPHLLRVLRPVEHRLSRFPFGGQYLLLGRKR